MELLAVVAIIGILGGLLLPALSLAKASAHSTTCKNRLHQMGLALQSYVNDHDNKYPSYVNPYDPSLDGEVGPENTRYWWAKLTPYYPVKWTNAAYHCPGYKGAIADETLRGAPYGSYGYNRYGVSYPRVGISYRPDLALGAAFFQEQAPRRSSAESRIRVPSEMLAISESRFVSPQVNGTPGGRDELVCGHLSTIPIPEPQFAFDPKRHGKSLFCDGHIAAMNPWVLFNPTNSAVLWNAAHEPHPESWVP